jgi:hypothetical protein
MKDQPRRPDPLLPVHRLGDEFGACLGLLAVEERALRAAARPDGPLGLLRLARADGAGRVVLLFRESGMDRDRALFLPEPYGAPDLAALPGFRAPARPGRA